MGMNPYPLGMDPYPHLKKIFEFLANLFFIKFELDIQIMEVFLFFQSDIFLQNYEEFCK